jgi:PAS domain S-box-containing protein
VHDASPADMALVLTDSLTDPVYMVDHTFRIIYANDAFVRHMVMPRSELMGAMIWDRILPNHRERLEPRYLRVMETGVSDSFVQESVVYPGRMVDVRVFKVFEGAAILFRDITRRVMAERALATSEEHLRRALLGADMGDFAWDAENDRMTFSQSALALYGLGAEHQGMSRDTLRRDHIHPDDLEDVRRTANHAHQALGQYDVEYRVKRAGGWRWMRAMGGPQVVDDKLIGIHGLVQDIHEKKLAEARLQAEIEERERAQQRQLLLIHELNHRVKNILAMVQAIASQTLSSAATPEAARLGLEQRLSALASAHDVLTRESWDGAELLDVIAGAVAPYEDATGRRFRVTGPQVRLEPKTAVSLSMALHELATNAVKYGALSADGWVEVNWSVQPGAEGRELRLEWSEHGGPPVAPPGHKGFGTRLITRSLAAELGLAELDFRPEGLVCRLSVRLP